VLVHDTKGGKKLKPIYGLWSLVNPLNLVHEKVSN
jgi:hypothetical protein